MCLKANIHLNLCFNLCLGSVPAPRGATAQGRAAVGSLWDVAFPAATMALGSACPYGTGVLKSGRVPQYHRIIES